MKNWWIFLILIGLVFLFMWCGVKGPPISPEDLIYGSTEEKNSNSTIDEQED